MLIDPLNECYLPMHLITMNVILDSVEVLCVERFRSDKRSSICR